MNREIIIDVGPTGVIKIEAIGFEGKACEKATAAIEKALGRVVEKKQTHEARKIKRAEVKVHRG